MGSRRVSDRAPQDTQDTTSWFQTCNSGQDARSTQKTRPTRLVRITTSKEADPLTRTNNPGRVRSIDVSGEVSDKRHRPADRTSSISLDLSSSVQKERSAELWSPPTSPKYKWKQNDGDPYEGMRDTSKLVTLVESKWEGFLYRKGGRQYFDSVVKRQGLRVVQFSVGDDVLVLAPEGIEPYAARIVALYQSGKEEQKTAQLSWYYRVGDCKTKRKSQTNSPLAAKELFASDYTDDNSIESFLKPCYVLPYDQFLEQGCELYDDVFFCREHYEFTTDTFSSFAKQMRKRDIKLALREISRRKTISHQKPNIGNEYQCLIPNERDMSPVRERGDELVFRAEIAFQGRSGPDHEAKQLIERWKDLVPNSESKSREGVLMALHKSRGDNRMATLTLKDARRQIELQCSQRNSHSALEAQIKREEDPGNVSNSRSARDDAPVQRTGSEGWLSLRRSSSNPEDSSPQCPKFALGSKLIKLQQAASTVPQSKPRGPVVCALHREGHEGPPIGVSPSSGRAESTTSTRNPGSGWAQSVTQSQSQAMPTKRRHSAFVEAVSNVSAGTRNCIEDMSRFSAGKSSSVSVAAETVRTGRTVSKAIGSHAKISSWTNSSRKGSAFHSGISKNRTYNTRNVSGQSGRITRRSALGPLAQV